MVGKLKIRNLVVIGVGLVGASFALALKRARAVGHVVGVGRTRRNLAAARRLRVIDEVQSDPARAVRDADLVLISTPVGQMGAVMTEIAPHLSPRTVVTDGGSTKRDVIASARRFLGARLRRFVPGHPIAGTEKSGASAGFAELYRDRCVVLTPLAETDQDAVRLVRRAWAACGARVVALDAGEHDEMLAAVSHLPHVVAYALVNALGQRRDAARLLRFSAGGLRDTVRIAGSSPEMWADICIANRDALLAALDDYEDALGETRAAIERGDAGTLKRLFVQARAARERWLVKKS